MLKKGNKCIWTVNPKLAMDHWRFVRRAIFYNTGRFEQGRKKANRLMEGLTRQSWHFMSTGSPFVLFNVAYIPTKFLLFEKEFYDWLFARVTNANSRCWPKEEKRLLAWVQLKETSFLLRDSATPLSIVIGTLDDPWWSCYDWGGPRLQLQQCKNLLMTSFLAVRFSQAHERREPRHSLLYEATKTKVSVSTVNPNMKTLTLLSSSCTTTTTDDPLEQQQRKPPGFHFLCKFLFCLYSICCNCHFKWPDLLYNASHRLPISIF